MEQDGYFFMSKILFTIANWHIKYIVKIIIPVIIPPPIIGVWANRHPVADPITILVYHIFDFFLHISIINYANGYGIAVGCIMGENG